MLNKAEHKTDLLKVKIQNLVNGTKRLESDINDLKKKSTDELKKSTDELKSKTKRIDELEKQLMMFGTKKTVLEMQLNHDKAGSYTIAVSFRLDFVWNMKYTHIFFLFYYFPLF